MRYEILFVTPVFTHFDVNEQRYSGFGGHRLTLRRSGVDVEPIEHFDVMTDPRDKTRPTVVRQVESDFGGITRKRVLPLCEKRIAVVSAYKRALKAGHVLFPDEMPAHEAP